MILISIIYYESLYQSLIYYEPSPYQDLDAAVGELKSAAAAAGPHR
jgi:hypothetical protein